MAISIVQTATQNFVSEHQPAKLSFTSNTTSGNTVIVILLCSNSDAFPMSSQDCFLNNLLVPGTYAVWNPGNGNGIMEAGLFGIYATAWVMPNVPVANGITLEMTNMQNLYMMVAYEVAGLGAAPNIDQIVFNTGTSGAIDSGATLPAQFAPELSIAVGVDFAGDAAGPSGGGWTAVEGTGATSAWVGYQINTTLGTTYEWQQPSTTGLWIAGIVTLYSQPLVQTIGPVNIPPGSDEGRFRFIVEEAVTGKILSRDLNVTKPKVLRALSGPCQIEFDVDFRDLSAIGIGFKPWGHVINVEKMIYGKRHIWASGIIQPGDIDKKTGVLHLKAQGFAGYPKGMPWLENWNPLTCDPFQAIQKVWAHLQSYSNGNLGVVVYPTTCGLEMLPGYAFDGNILNLNFFAEYIRAQDKNDCGDFIDNLAKSIPLDYVEYASWNNNYTSINKAIFLGYPKAGVQQDYLSFIINENVIEAIPYVETQIDWASDVVVDGWFPGSEYSATFTNPLPNRYRRVLKEDDARINSNELAAAWAKRKLSKRQTPAHWTNITAIMGHPNAPFGTYDVGDRIWVSGYMPWVGDVTQLHKILAIEVQEDQGTCSLTLMAEGAFNYAPVYYQGSISGSTTMQQTATVDIPITTYNAQIGPG